MHMYLRSFWLVSASSLMYPNFTQLSCHEHHPAVYTTTESLSCSIFAAGAVVTGILYAIDAKFSILIKITAIGGPLSSGGPDVDLEADVVEGPVRGINRRSIL